MSEGAESSGVSSHLRAPWLQTHPRSLCVSGLACSLSRLWVSSELSGFCLQLKDVQLGELVSPNGLLFADVHI